MNEPHQGQSSPSRELPHDILAEKSLLSCLLIDSLAFEETTDLSLERNDFYHPKYGILFEAIHELVSESRPVDYVTVCAKLADNGKIEQIGGQTFVLDIVEDQASSANVYYYAKMVKDKSVMRNVVREAMRVVENGLGYKGKTEDFIKDVESRFFKLTVEAKSGGMQKLVTCLKDNLKELEDDSRPVGEIGGLSSGFKKLDEKLLGLQAGQLVILAARPAMGKSALALNVAVNSAKLSGLPVAYFSLEMLSNELSMRLLSSEAKVDSRRLRTKNFLDTDLRNIGNAVTRLSSLPIYLNDAGDTSLLDIQSQCRKIRAEQGLGMVVIDYLQLMKPVNGSMPREQQISEISRGLKNLAKELECPVISLSQLNRAVEARTDKRPMVSDLRESGSIEQDADIVLLLYRDEVYNPDTKEKGVAEVIVGKNRSGEVGTAKLSWVGPYTSFGDLAGGEEPHQMN
jgi:replicative DNA helicase